MSAGAESLIRDACLRLGISAGQLQTLRVKFRREHGPKADAQLARYLDRLWAELGDHPRFPAAGGGHATAESTDEASDEARGYTGNALRAVEPGVEAVPAEYQDAITNRSRRDWEIVRAEELERRELNQLASTLRNVSKRAPRGTDFKLDALRAAVRALEERCLDRAA